MKNVVWAIALVASGNCFGGAGMDQDTLEGIVANLSPEAKGGKGVVEFVFNQVKMYLISDASHDRMRIIAPVAEYAKLSKPQVDAALESNFHKALDARYAVSDGVLYSAYIHPLSAMSEAQVESAVTQVSNLARSFGGEYTSGVLTYGGKH